MAKDKKKTVTAEQRTIAEAEIQKQSKTIKYDTKDYTIGYLVEGFHPKKESSGDEDFGNKRFFIPDYQRNSVWDDADRSAFIESILLGFPIPFLFFCEREDGTIEIVDGVQRVTTLEAFLHDRFYLSKMTKLSALNGFKFSDLSDATRRKFQNKSLRIVVLEGATPIEFRKDLFSRVNKSGRKINPSEFRRGTFPGALTQFIEKCSENERFKKLCPLNEQKVKRYARFELVLRFFAFVNNYKEFKHDVAPFLDFFLEQNQNNFDEKQYKDEFDRMCAFVEQYFPLGFARSKQSVPNVRFEAISVGVALALRENKNLTASSVDWLQSDEFEEHTTSDSSNNPGRLERRVEFVRDCLLEGEQWRQRLHFTKNGDQK
jgi:uncharacterized protein with ParB-like and HNH nuclease domain